MSETCFMDCAVLDNCQNLEDSYGEICVFCNCCGRVDKATQLESQLLTYKRHLEEEEQFDSWIEGWEETQRKNKAASIDTLKKKIKQVEDELNTKRAD